MTLEQTPKGKKEPDKGTPREQRPGRWNSQCEIGTVGARTAFLSPEEPSRAIVCCGARTPGNGLDLQHDELDGGDRMHSTGDNGRTLPGRLLEQKMILRCLRESGQH